MRHSNLRAEQEPWEKKKLGEKKHERKGQWLRESAENLASQRQLGALKDMRRSRQKLKKEFTAVK